MKCVDGVGLCNLYHAETVVETANLMGKMFVSIMLYNDFDLKLISVQCLNLYSLCVKSKLLSHSFALQVFLCLTVTDKKFVLEILAPKLILVCGVLI